MDVRIEDEAHGFSLRLGQSPVGPIQLTLTPVEADEVMVEFMMGNLIRSTRQAKRQEVRELIETWVKIFQSASYRLNA